MSVQLRAQLGRHSAVRATGLSALLLLTVAATVALHVAAWRAAWWLLVRGWALATVTGPRAYRTWTARRRP